MNVIQSCGTPPFTAVTHEMNGTPPCTVAAHYMNVIKGIVSRDWGQVHWILIYRSEEFRVIGAYI